MQVIEAKARFIDQCLAEDVGLGSHVVGAVVLVAGLAAAVEDGAEDNLTTPTGADLVEVAIAGVSRILGADRIVHARIPLERVVSNGKGAGVVIPQG